MASPSANGMMASATANGMMAPAMPALVFGTAESLSGARPQPEPDP